MCRLLRKGYTWSVFAIRQRDVCVSRARIGEQHFVFTRETKVKCSLCLREFFVGIVYVYTIMCYGRDRPPSIYVTNTRTKHAHRYYLIFEAQTYRQSRLCRFGTCDRG